MLLALDVLEQELLLVLLVLLASSTTVALALLVPHVLPPNFR